MNERQIAVMSVTLVCAVVAGCGGSSNPANGPDGSGQVRYATNGTFTMAVTTDIGAFDPYRSYTTWPVEKLVYDSLVNLRADGTFVSGLAEEWSANANGATFVLRDDVTCSDGTPLTAGHVAGALTYVTDLENQSSKLEMLPTVPFTVTGDDSTRTVTVALESPFGFLLNTIGLVPIVCPRGLADIEILASGSDGTGPFVLTEAVPGQSYTFTVRDGYTWGPDGASTNAPGTPATVIIRVIANETTAANLLLSGELNLAMISGQDHQRLVAQGLAKFERPRQSFVWFNQAGDRPAADRAVREALVRAIDLPELIEVYTAGIGDPVTGLVGMDPKPCEGDTVTGNLPEFDVAAAEELLDEAGWPTGTDGIRAKDGRPLAIDLHYVPTTSSFERPAAELLAQKWEAIGADVTITTDTGATLSQVLFETTNYDVYFTPMLFNLPSAAVPYLSGPVPPNGLNFSGIRNDRYGELVAEAATLPAPESCEFWNRAEEALLEQLDFLPVGSQSVAYYLQKAEAQTSAFDIPVPTSIRVLQ